MRTHLIIICMATCISVISCNKPDSVLAPIDDTSYLDGIYSRDGVLAFKSFDIFGSFIKRSNNLSREERANFEKKYNYKSVQSSYESSTETIEYYRGALGTLLNKDMLVIIGDSLYHFDSKHVRSILIKGSSLIDAIKEIKQSNTQLNSLIRTTDIETTPISTVGSNMYARSGSGYISTSQSIRVGDGNYYSTAQVYGNVVRLNQSAIIVVSIKLTAFIFINGKQYPSTCSGTVQQASGNMNVSPLNLDSYIYPFTFDTGALNGGGSQSVNIYTVPPINDPNYGIRASSISFAGTGSFYANQADCGNLTGRSILTSGSINL